jgi:hypothetical protein
LAGLLLLAAQPAPAQEVPYATRQEDGVTVYTNGSAARMSRFIRVRRQGNGNSYVSIVASPPPLRPALGPVPTDLSYGASSFRPPSRFISYGVTFQDLQGQTVRQVVQADLASIIDRHARTHNVDPLLIDLIIKYESNYNPYAVSPAGAIGLMQLMPGTAAALGVDPYDPDANVYGGTAYISQQLRRFKDLRLALAAYNAGPGAVEEYGAVPPYAETVAYVENIVGEYVALRKRYNRSGRLASRGGRTGTGVGASVPARAARPAGTASPETASSPSQAPAEPQAQAQPQPPASAAPAPSSSGLLQPNAPPGYYSSGPSSAPARPPGY